MNRHRTFLDLSSETVQHLEFVPLQPNLWSLVDALLQVLTALSMINQTLNIAVPLASLALPHNRLSLFSSIASHVFKTISAFHYSPKAIIVVSQNYSFPELFCLRNLIGEIGFLVCSKVDYFRIINVFEVLMRCEIAFSILIKALSGYCRGHLRVIDQF